MADTLGYYNKKAKEYFDNTVNADMYEVRRRFLKYLKNGAYILDAGCGSGRDSKYFLENGFEVKAIDGSEEMCRLASEYIGQPVECVRFEDLNYREEFEGIWACASLLHVKRNKLPEVLEKLYSSLTDDGVIYASFKCGDRERVLGERYFNDLNEKTVRKLFGSFEILELWISDDVRQERKDRWINIVAKKHVHTIYGLGR